MFYFFLNIPINIINFDNVNLHYGQLQLLDKKILHNTFSYFSEFMT